MHPIEKISAYAVMAWLIDISGAENLRLGTMEKFSTFER
jgi:hypothetical protein